MNLKIIISFFLFMVFTSEKSYSQSDSQKIRTLLRAAASYEGTNPDSAIFMSAQALEMARAGNNLWAIGKSQQIAGRAKDLKGDYLGAIRHYSDALNSLNKADSADYYGRYSISRNIAVIQANYGLYEESRDYYDSAQNYLKIHIRIFPEIANKYKDHLRVYDVSYFRALTLFKEGSLEEAIQALHSLRKTSGLPEGIQLDILNRLGLIYSELGSMKESIHYFQSILDSHLADSLYKGRAYHNIAAQYFKKQEYSVAVEHYLLAVSVKQNTKNKASLFLSYLDLGETFLKIKDFESSSKFLRMAIDLNVELSTSPEKFIVFQYLGMALIDLDPDQARENLQKYSELSLRYKVEGEVLSKENRARALRTVMSDYEDKLLFETQTESQVQKHKMSVLFVIISLLLIGCLTVLGIYYKHKYEKKRFYKEMINTKF